MINENTNQKFMTKEEKFTEIKQGGPNSTPLKLPTPVPAELVKINTPKPPETQK